MNTTGHGADPAEQQFEATEKRRGMDGRTWARHNRARLAAAMLTMLGAFVLVLGWLGVARSAFPAEQLPYLISGGLGGIALVGLGALVWLSADLNDEWTKLDLIEDALRRLASDGSRPELIDRAEPRRAEPDGVSGPLDLAAQRRPIRVSR